MKKIFVLLMVLCCSQVFAQKRADKQLSSAIEVYQEASDVNGMLEALILFKKVSDNRPTSWIPAYWTAFVFSQTGRLTETPLPYYDSAQLYLDRIADVEKLPQAEQSDVHALQSLIYSLKSGSYWSVGDRDNGMKFSNLENDALTKAILTNEENPRAYLLSGTGLIGDGMRMKNPGYLLAGRKMLELAKTKYEASKPENELYPDWGEGWINFWMARAKIGED